MTSSLASGGSGGSSSTATGYPPEACDGTPTDDETFATAMDVLRGEIELRRATGGAIAVLRDGELLHMGVAGSKREGVCDPVTFDTVFQLGWQSQLLTTIAVLDAIEDGAFTLETPITELLPDLSAEGDLEAVQVRHLLTYSSMFRAPSDRLMGGPLIPGFAVCGELGEVFLTGGDRVVQAPPGTLHDPDDVSNFELLGWILERTEGQAFREVIERRVLAPLTMGGAYERATIEALDHAVPRFYQDSRDSDLWADCRNRDPSVGYFGSVRDLSKLLAPLVRGEGPILESASWRSMLEVQGPHFFSAMARAYGLDGEPLVLGEQGDDVWYNDSYASGFATGVWVFDQRGLVVIGMLNVGDTVPMLIERVARTFDESIPPFDGTSLPLDPEAVSFLLGTYVDELGFEGSGPRTLEIGLDEEGDLVATLTVSDVEVPYALEPGASIDNFTLKEIDGAGPARTVYGRFWRDDLGAVEVLQIAQDHGPPFWRVPVE